MRVLTGGYRTQPGSRLQVLADDGSHHDRWTGVLTAASSMIETRKVFPAGGIGCLKRAVLGAGTRVCDRRAGVQEGSLPRWRV